MKKLFFVFTLIIATSFAAVAGPIVTLTVQIGKKSEACAGFAFCGISVSAGSRLASAQIDDNSNTLLLNISREAASGKENYLSGNYVKFEEAVVLPADVIKALGRKSGITINVGTYSVVKTAAGYQIAIPLGTTGVK